MTPEAETPSLQLLVAAAFTWIASDFVWIWLTLIGDYVPGSSGDAGWMVAFALCGSAALHPSMGAVSAKRIARPTIVRWPFFALMAAALLACPVVTAYGLLLREETNSVGTVAITAILSLLVLVRLALLLRGEQRLRHEVALRNERLLELDRMKDAFVASVSHELRTPLTAIRGFTTTLVERWSRLSDEDKLTFLHTIDSQAKRLNRLVDTVLLLARIQAGRVSAVREPLDIANPARDAVEELGIDVTIDVDGETAPFVQGDRDQLHQIFVNLIVNAQRYGYTADSCPDRQRRRGRDRSCLGRRGGRAGGLRSAPLRRLHPGAEQQSGAGVRARPRNRQRARRNVRRRGLVRACTAKGRLLRRQVPAPRRAGRAAARITAPRRRPTIGRMDAYVAVHVRRLPAGPPS